MSNYKKEEKLRKDILKNCLENLETYGWSEKLLSIASENITNDPTIGKMIFGDIKGLVNYHLKNNDQKMLDALNKSDTAKLKIREKIKLALLTRFKLGTAEQIKQTASFLILPQNSDVGFKSLARTCDIIWRFAGDESTDFNYYTKRTLLAGVYSATILYYLKSNPNESELDSFITARLENVLTIGKVKTSILDMVDSVKQKIL